MSKRARVAQAVEYVLTDYGVFRHAFDAVEDYTELMDEIGRAAIEAMREPTEAMLEIGNHVRSGPHNKTRYLQDIWQAMTAEALK
jgi:hypothetical protein